MKPPMRPKMASRVRCWRALRLSSIEVSALSAIVWSSACMIASAIQPISAGMRKPASFCQMCSSAGISRADKDQRQRDHRPARRPGQPLDQDVVRLAVACPARTVAEARTGCGVRGSATATGDCTAAITAVTSCWSQSGRVCGELRQVFKHVASPTSGPFSRLSIASYAKRASRKGQSPRSVRRAPARA